MNPSAEPDDRQPFPTFASLREAEAYSDKTGDAYFEICYHLEGALNLSLAEMHDLYANAQPAKRPKMQTGIVRGRICPEGWPNHAKILIHTLVACARFRHEDTCHAHTVKQAMAALVLEKELDGTLHDATFDERAFEPITPEDAKHARLDLLRLCDWFESCLHHSTHTAWYAAPDCFSQDPEQAHLANIGIGQRHLAMFSERDRKRWEGIHGRAAAKHKKDLKMWTTVGRVQHDPRPRTWTHPEVDTRLIGLWPLVLRYNWTYADLLKVLEKLLPEQPGGCDRRYPLDSVESLKVHCRSICGLTKSTKGRSASGLPRGWQVAVRLFPPIGK